MQSIARLSDYVVLAVMSSLLVTLPVFGLRYYEQDYQSGIPLVTTDCCFAHPPANVSVQIMQTSGPSNITATVIAPNYILTVAHWWISSPPYAPGQAQVVVPGDSNVYQLADERQGASVGGQWTPDLAVYRIVKCSGTGSSTAQQCAHVEDANLTNWVDLYDITSERSAEAVIASYGRQHAVGIKGRSGDKGSQAIL